MRKGYILVFIISILFICCSKEKKITPVTPVKIDSIKITSFIIEATKNLGLVKEDIVATISNNEIHALIPSVDRNKKLIVTFSTNGQAFVNDTLQISGVTKTDFAEPVLYHLTDKYGQFKDYNIIFTTFTNIPILYLTTNGPVISKDDYVTGDLIINANGRFNQSTNAIPLQIKGRGNSTWTMPKKPFRLKFDSKAEILDMPMAKNWVLLANYSDKTLLRNRVAMDLGSMIGSDFTPPSRFVEVVMNGQYLGNYLLTSQVEVDKNRIDIADLKGGDDRPANITGGYVLELENRDIEPLSFMTDKNLSFNINTPDNISTAQLNYIHQYFQQAESALFASNYTDPHLGYEHYINTDSFINWFIVEELMKNNDSKDWTSMFYYKDRNGKIGMGPLWDFDLTAGNVDYSEAKATTGWWVKNSMWFSRLFEDPAFKAKLKARWTIVKSENLPKVMASIDVNATYLALSQKQNFITWPILDQYVWPNQFVLGTYEKEVVQLKSWLNERIAWMDGEISQY
jgi:spore coat protein CotH